MDNNEKLIKEKFDSLPQKLREVLTALSWQKTIAAIAQERGLSSDQSSALETETMLVLYGFLPIESYIDNLEQNLDIDSDLIGHIAEDVDARIFSELERKMKQPEAPQAIHNDLPLIEEGEAAHTVPHDTKLDAMPVPEPEANPVPIKKPEAAPTPAPVVPPPTPTAPAAPTGDIKLRPSSDTPIAKKTEAKTPDYRYPGGTDPYREPLS